MELSLIELKYWHAIRRMSRIRIRILGESETGMVEKGKQIQRPTDLQIHKDTVTCGIHTM